MRERRYDIDWLRVIAILIVFAFHSVVPFYAWYEWHIENAQKSQLIGWVIVAMYGWPMPLFMLLAGAATRFALRRRTYRQYVRERFTRVLLPFIVGVPLFALPQVYLGRLYRGEFQGSYLQFLPQAFEGGAYPEGNFSWEHLWFLLYLFVYALLALPLFRFLRGDTGRRWVSRLARFCESRGAIFTLALPLIVGQVGLGWRFPQTRALLDDWTWHWVLLFAFVYGYILFSDERFGRAIGRAWKKALVLALATSVVRVPLFVSLLDLTFEQPSYWVYHVSEAAIFRLSTWAWLVCALGSAQKYLNFNSGLLEHAGPTTYPFYMLHQTVIAIVAFYVVPWRVTIPAKYLVILITSFAVTVGLCDLARRWGVTRYLLGLRHRPTERQVAASGVERTASRSS